MFGLPEALAWAVIIVGGAAAVGMTYLFAVSNFLKRPSPSEAIIKIGAGETNVAIGRGIWVVPIFHRHAVISLSTIGLTIRRNSHEALISKDFISTNLSAEFYIRIEPNE